MLEWCPVMISCIHFVYERSVPRSHGLRTCLCHRGSKYVILIDFHSTHPPVLPRLMAAPGVVYYMLLEPPPRALQDDATSRVANGHRPQATCWSARLPLTLYHPTSLKSQRWVVGRRYYSYYMDPAIGAD